MQHDKQHELPCLYFTATATPAAPFLLSFLDKQGKYTVLYLCAESDSFQAGLTVTEFMFRMDFVLDDDTPVVEQRPFEQQESTADNKGKEEPKHQAGRGPATLLSDTSGSGSGSSSSSASSPPVVTTAAEGARPEDDLSNSYHEIFDAQKVTKQPQHRHNRNIDEEEDARTAELPCDSTARDTTDYLTNKLVEDSLKWQQRGDDGDYGDHGDKTVSASSSSVDPQVLLDLENDARHLATSVDSLVESLSGVLRSASALSVESVETYRYEVLNQTYLRHEFLLSCLGTPFARLATRWTATSSACTS